MGYHPELLHKHIHMLFLDNTLFNPVYDDYLVCQEAVDATVAVIKKNPFCHVIIAIDFLGKEKYCCDVGKVCLSVCLSVCLYGLACACVVGGVGLDG